MVGQNSFLALIGYALWVYAIVACIALYRVVLVLTFTKRADQFSASVDGTEPAWYVGFAVFWFFLGGGVCFRVVLVMNNQMNCHHGECLSD
jgi:hypothetical protein